LKQNLLFALLSLALVFSSYSGLLSSLKANAVTPVSNQLLQQHQHQLRLPAITSAPRSPNLEPNTVLAPRLLERTIITSAVDGNNIPVQNGRTTTSNSITFTFAFVAANTTNSNPVLVAPGVATRGTTTSTGIAGFQCTLDNFPLTAISCSSPATIHNLSSGNHIFQVRAIGTAGNREPIGASFSWTVVVSSIGRSGPQSFTSVPSNTFPSVPLLLQRTTIITSALDGNNIPVQNGGATTSNSITFTFAFGGVRGGTTNSNPVLVAPGGSTHSTNTIQGIGDFECALDNTSPSSCTSPATIHNLSSGNHIFQVRAIGTAGNREPIGASFSWSILTSSSPSSTSQPAGTTTTHIPSVPQSSNAIASGIGGINNTKASPSFPPTNKNNITAANATASTARTSTESNPSPKIASEGPLTSNLTRDNISKASSLSSHPNSTLSSKQPPSRLITIHPLGQVNVKALKVPLESEKTGPFLTRTVPFLTRNSTAFQHAQQRAAQHPGTPLRVITVPPPKPNAAQSLQMPPAAQSLQMPPAAQSLQMPPAAQGVSGIGFQGLSECQVNCYNPPDQAISVGPNQAMQFVNDEGQIYTKAGVSVKLFDLYSFFSSPGKTVAPSTDFIADPEIIFDQGSQTWFASVYDQSSPNGQPPFSENTLVAVSSSSDPSGTWTIYEFPVASGHFGDQPAIGVSDDKFAVSTNNYVAGNCLTCTTNTNTGTEYLIATKADLLKGTSATLYDSGENNEFSIIPVRDDSPGSTSTLYMVSNSPINAVDLYHVNGLPTDPSNPVSVTIVPFSISNVNCSPTCPGAQQPGTSTLLNTNDARIHYGGQPVYRDGEIWLAFNDACTPSPDSQVRSCFRLDQLSPSSSGTVTQDFDVGIAGTYVFYPALSIDSSDNLDVIFGYSDGSSNFPSLATTGQVAGSQGSLDPVIALAAGSIADTSGRYGDYFAAATDPSNPSIVYGGGEIAGGGGGTPGWSTVIGEMAKTNVWSGFFSLGGAIIGDPAVSRNADGRLEVFVVGTNHALYHKFQTVAGSNSWSGFASLGGYVIGDPVVGQDADGRLEVFVIGSNHALYHNVETSASNSNSYSGFSLLGGFIVGDPAVARNTDGTLEVFVVGANKQLYHNYESAANSITWVGYSSLGGAVILDPVVSQNSDGRLQLFVIGTNNAVFSKFQTSPSSHGSYSGFFSLGGAVIKDPAVARNTDGRLELFVIGSNNALYHNAQTNAGINSWTGFATLGGSVIKKPAVAQNEDGRLVVFVIQSDKALYYDIQSTVGSFSSYSGFVSLGGAVVSDPVVAQNSDKRLEVLVIGSDNGLWHIFQLS